MNVFHVNVHSTNVHTNHFINCATHLCLDGTAYFADIHIAVEDHKKVHKYCIILDGNPDAFTRSFCKKPVYSSRDIA